MTLVFIRNCFTVDLYTKLKLLNVNIGTAEKTHAKSFLFVEEYVLVLELNFLYLNKLEEELVKLYSA